MRPVLDKTLRRLYTGISEFTFANIYLFRKKHLYRVSLIEEMPLIAGADKGGPFFMLPAGLPSTGALYTLFERFAFLKCASVAQAGALAKEGFKAVEDRDNFDYLYSREELSRLSGRRFHAKKNLVNQFLSRYACEARGLTLELVPDALRVLDSWRRDNPLEDDFDAAREALVDYGPLGLTGAIYYVDGKPSAYVAGEELLPDTFAIHFQKWAAGMKGLLQYATQAFASALPVEYVNINMEQDLGDEGLRKSKESWRPAGFVRKYRVTR